MIGGGIDSYPLLAGRGNDADGQDEDIRFDGLISDRLLEARCCASRR